MSAQPNLPEPPTRPRPARVHERFHARVSGRDRDGERFKLYTVIDNLGAGGLYLKMPRGVKPGATLSVVVRFSTRRFEPTTDEVSCLAASGRVLRAEPQPDGRWGVAVEFRRHRFI